MKKYTTKALSFLLAALLVLGMVPIPRASAIQMGKEYSIANDYIKYSLNARTGGFCIETKDGHPQKTFDNNIPLLYKEDRSRSNGTSFTTVRIDGKDYVFGQDYGWFGIDSELHTPVISDEGRLMTVDWDIKGYTVTQKVAISLDDNNNLCGNVGISYTVQNNNRKSGEVGIRLLLDNALDTDVDAPYVMVNQISPTLVETEYTGEIPQQFRYMNSLSAPDKMAYALLGGWSGSSEVEVDRVIVGHWVNLANTRYQYTPDSSCDFSNYSNQYLVPDTATAFYWSEKTLAAGGQRTSEMLYGIGNFSSELSDERLGIDMTVGKVELDDTGEAYQDGGKFDVKATINNNVEGARILLEPVITLTVDEGLTFEKTGKREYKVAIDGGLLAGSVKDITATVIADEQAQITSKRVVVSVNAMEVVDENTQKSVEYSTNRNVLLPAVSGLLPSIKMNQVNPERVYYEGEKSVTVSGDMEELSEALRASDGWRLDLISRATKERTLIEKKNISFVSEGKTMSFSTNELLAVGEYDIVFSFSDAQLKRSFGKEIRSSATLQVSNDVLDRCVSYGIVAMVRFDAAGTHRKLYDFVNFANEGEMNSFLEGEITKNGLQHTDICFEDSSEVLLVMRGKFHAMIDEEGNHFYQASETDGDITINNILAYSGDEPLKLTCDSDGTEVFGDGKLQVINSINVWHNAWSFGCENGSKYTLDGDDVEENEGEPLVLSLDGAGKMVQFIGGFLIDLKYGVMTQDDDLYGISFGGKITLPIKASDKDSKDTNNGKKDDGKDKDDEKDEGEISAEIEDVLFGQKDDESVGFCGINATFSVELPEDVLGSMVKNACGVEAEVTINTIEHYYRVNLGVELAMLECEGSIAFKQVPVKSVPRILPDELSFYLGGEIMQIPLVPPSIFMTGLGGGISDLADTCSDDSVGELPPLTIQLRTQLLLIETLVGDFELEVCLSGMDFEGELKLKGDDDGEILKMNAGLSARWVTPFYINAYGDISICDGLLKGGFTIKISNDYFYGYVYAGLFIPDSIPFVGGMELAGIEAAISSDFVGANIKIIGIKFGVIFYWDGEYKFGRSIDLSSRGDALTYMPDSYINQQNQLVDYTAVYGTNMRRLTSTLLPMTRAGSGITKYFDPEAEDALLMEIPLEGFAEPKQEDIVLTNPNGNPLKMIPNDGAGGGNYLIQNRDGKNYLYITITDSEQLIAGNWNLEIKTEGVTVSDFEVNGVDNLPVLTEVSYAHADAKDRQLAVEWKTDCVSEMPGTLDVYLTDDPNVLEKMEQSQTTEDSAMESVARVELEHIQSGSAEVTIPDTFPEGEYYVVTMLSQYEGGISKVISSQAFSFENPTLPAAPAGAELSYGGNGTVCVTVSETEDSNANYYIVTLLDAEGNEIPNSYGKYEAGKKILFAPTDSTSNEPILQAGTQYRAHVTALRLETTEEHEEAYYYSTNSVVSEPFTMPEIQKPVLQSVEHNLPEASDDEMIYLNEGEYSATYTFNMPVSFTLLVDGVEYKQDGEVNASWKVKIPLEDGVHTVGFKAVTQQGDVCVSDASVADALLGFCVDTKAPILSFGEAAGESMNEDAEQPTVSQQTVFVQEDGTIQVVGLTEKEAVLTLDDSTEGVTMNSNGTFEINRPHASTCANETLVLKAEDRAGNKTTLRVNVANRSLAAFESLQLISDLENEQEKPEYIELSVGNHTQLTVTGISDQNQVELQPENIVWSVLYEQNVVKLTQDGFLTALAPGETAIKASYRVAAFTDEEGKQSYAEVSDVISVKIKEIGYRYELIQTQGHTVLTVKAPISKGFATIERSEGTTVMLYDTQKQAYMAAFPGNLTSEQLLEHLVFRTGEETVPLLLRGDSNGDGKVDKIDVTATLEAILHEEFGSDSHAQRWLLENANGDDVINIIDAQLMLNQYLQQ